MEYNFFSGDAPRISIFGPKREAARLLVANRNLCNYRTGIFVLETTLGSSQGRIQRG